MIENIEMPLVRSHTYKLFSLAFLKPDDELKNLLKKGEFQLSIEDAFKRLNVSSYKLNISGETIDNLEETYYMVFGHSTPKEYPPYETEYGVSHVFMQSQELADISGFYKAFGLDISKSAFERLDHITVELEFMAYLTFKEAHAIREGNPKNIELCRDAQRKFFKDHIGRWVPAFANRLKKAFDTTFYTQVAQALKAFLDAEANFLSVDPSQMRYIDAMPVSFAPEGDCFSCGDANVCNTFFNQKEV
ncbi:MAG: hypothetical protein A2W23_01315 [Planctomycetes bacterium RBG_16_43_13]|nr:MAG: hypothetical protein A2W23_01315 [Planctomycetes bacterium RBG_16_43_13]